MATKLKKASRTNCNGALRVPIGGHRTSLQFQQVQSKTKIELAAIVGAATGETGDCAFNLAYAREIAPAIRATIDETPRITLRWKRQRMAALLACDSQIATSLMPLGSVR